MTSFDPADPAHDYGRAPKDFLAPGASSSEEEEEAGVEKY
jgi:hypothetical protein